MVAAGPIDYGFAIFRPGQRIGAKFARQDVAVIWSAEGGDRRYHCCAATKMPPASGSVSAVKILDHKIAYWQP